MVKYVEMQCDLTGHEIANVALPPEVVCKPVGEVPAQPLYRCYEATFEAGDAQFFFAQNEQERRDYFDTLGLVEAADEPASVVLVQDQQVIGFSLVLARGAPTNRHISCMCIHPDFQGRGLGKTLLWLIMHEVKAQGGQTITLGTEPGMRAFALYRSNGFVITAEHDIS